MAKYFMRLCGSEDNGKEVVMSLNKEQEKFVIDLAARLNKGHNKYAPYFVVENLDEKKKQLDAYRKRVEEECKAKIDHATGNDVKRPSAMEEAFNKARK